MGVDPAFWVALERIHAAAKAFDREMWAENKKGSLRVWELLSMNGEKSSALAAGRECRIEFFAELEHRGEDAVLRALDTLSAHIQWILVTGAEAMLSSGGARLFNQLSGQSGVSSVGRSEECELFLLKKMRSFSLTRVLMRCHLEHH